MKKILVTAVGGDIGYALIKAIKNSSHDLYIIGCDIKKYNMSSDLVDEFYACPPYRDVEQWTDYMLTMISENGVDYFWPVTEPEIKIVNERRSQFSLTQVIMNQENILSVAMDKGETARILYENGVLTPMHIRRLISKRQSRMVSRSSFSSSPSRSHSLHLAS